jgi:hypothetical protein
MSLTRIILILSLLAGLSVAAVGQQTRENPCMSPSGCLTSGICGKPRVKPMPQRMRFRFMPIRQRVPLPQPFPDRRGPLLDSPLKMQQDFSFVLVENS